MTMFHITVLGISAEFPRNVSTDCTAASVSTAATSPVSAAKVVPQQTHSSVATVLEYCVVLPSKNMTPQGLDKPNQGIRFRY
jgi:hypothetical protein